MRIVLVCYLAGIPGVEINNWHSNSATRIQQGRRRARAHSFSSRMSKQTSKSVDLTTSNQQPKFNQRDQLQYYKLETTIDLAKLAFKRKKSKQYFRLKKLHNNIFQKILAGQFTARKQPIDELHSIDEKK